MKKILCFLLCLGLLTACHQTSSKIEAQNGDVVNIDYVGKLDGVAFSGGTAQGALLELGSGTFIDGFEDQLIGVEQAQQKTITVTFPSQYGSVYIDGEEVDLSNQNVIFEVGVNHVYREANGQ